jgi:Flp pilus assembly pilin Flp
MTIKHGVKRFLRDESGQTTTEYILILAVVVTVIMQFRSKFKDIINRLLNGVDGAATQAAGEMGQ